jgi:endonuclease/exonuclease/phosphatase family metal-dependent hydrolase
MPLRIATWNIGWFGQLLKGYTRTIPRESKRVRGAAALAKQHLQREKIAEEIQRVDPDVLCIQEGPSTGNIGRLRAFCEEDLADRTHNHYRHPQVLLLTLGDKRVDIIGCHFKSKFGGEDYREAGLLRQKEHTTKKERDLIKKVEQTAVESRIKLSTEITNVRYYIDNRFRNEPDPVVFVCGDFDDGVGKEVFERKYLFHDSVSNMQGDVFFASRFLNHALFDFLQAGGENHRWTARFIDVWDPGRTPEILLDHILFTQSICGAEALSAAGLKVPPHSGRVEHAIHNSVNSAFDREDDYTSDHRPVTLDVQLSSDIS